MPEYACGILHWLGNRTYRFGYRLSVNPNVDNLLKLDNPGNVRGAMNCATTDVLFLIVKLLLRNGFGFLTNLQFI